MKKQFFYAALAIALMSSCSKDNDPGTTTEPVNPNPGEVVDEGTPVAIQLGISNPTIAATRGTGSVGGTGIGTDLNEWNGQALSLFMVEQGTMKKAMEGVTGAQTYIFEGLTFNAPKTGVSDKILITGTPENVKYYPLTGKYDFYGYHMDMTPAPTPAFDETANKMTVAVAIDGTNDVMAAKAELTDAQKDETVGATSNAGKLIPADFDKAFSSWTARRGVHPVLKFKHMLSRLKFNIKAGEEKAAIDYYADKAIENHDFDGKNEATGTMTDGAVYIKKITLTGQQSGITLTITPTENTVTADGATANFELKQRAAVNTPAAELEALTPTATAKFGEATSIGESMMVFPDQETFIVEIDVAQYVVVHETAGVADAYAWKTNTMTTTVKAPTQMPDPANPGAKIESTDKNAGGKFIFAKGKSYNINITVYGYQRIDITAELTGWISGDDVEVNPEDDAFNTVP